MWTTECNCWMSMQKACNLLHMPQPPNDCAHAEIAIIHWVLYCRFMDDRSYVGPQGLHRPNANPINCLPACRWQNDSTAYCCRAHKSYSSFPLAWIKVLPECLWQGISAIMILLMGQNHYVLCNFIDSSKFPYRFTYCGLKSPDPSSTSQYWKWLVLKNGMGMASETIFCSAAVTL